MKRAKLTSNLVIERKLQRSHLHLKRRFEKFWQNLNSLCKSSSLLFGVKISELWIQTSVDLYWQGFRPLQTSSDLYWH
ncbi:hypothetical protein SUGI_0636280 [Cryptomeria japonica]|nr:hypothetical protein SUGI_0636280 [Cryptomeria japonica]